MRTFLCIDFRLADLLCWPRSRVTSSECKLLPGRSFCLCFLPFWSFPDIISGTRTLWCLGNCGFKWSDCRKMITKFSKRSWESPQRAGHIPESWLNYQKRTSKSPVPVSHNYLWENWHLLQEPATCNNSNTVEILNIKKRKINNMWHMKTMFSFLILIAHVVNQHCVLIQSDSVCRNVSVQLTRWHKVQSHVIGDTGFSAEGK